ncbi:MAG: hypothetical protein VZR09_06135 [Candidatus Gastranaerophilaceae bacterium]|nr:hypothetical protein [Candidatus Gastranaerophilaceae bacterium]
MLNHEMWRDETQPWCIVRDYTWNEFLDILKIEGHPLPFFLILMPFAKLGFSVYTVQIIGLIFLYLAAGYLIFKSPFNKLTKCLIVLSSAMLYFYPIIVRDLVLIPIILFILADIYAKRKAHPFLYTLTLILLSNTNFLIVGFCAATMGLFSTELIIQTIKEKKYINLVPIVLFFINASYIYLFFHKAAYLNDCYFQWTNNTSPIATALKDFAFVFFQHPFSNNLVTLILFYSLLIIVLARLFIRHKQMFTVFLLSVFYHFYIYYKVWFGGVKPQKAYLLLFILIFCFWVIENVKKDKILNAVIVVIFAINCLFSINNFISDVKYNYTGAKETAQYIRQNLNDEITFCVEGPPYFFTSIAAYLPDKKFFSLDEKHFTSYHNFSRIKNRNYNKTINCKYYISEYTINPKEIGILIFNSSNSISHNPENFRIYKLK